MHETLNPEVLGYIDDKILIDEKNICYKGWCFHKILHILPLRIIIDDSINNLETFDKSSVGDFYKNKNILHCGWSLLIPIDKQCILEMNINGYWVPIFNFDTINTSTKKQIPSFVVIDNFYNNPDEVRNFALKQNFQENIKYHKGKRICNPLFRFSGLKERFEQILDCKIKNWEKYGTNGCFQYCVAEDKSVYHVDTQEYAAIIYLTPNAPVQSGTQFFRSKNTKKMTTDLSDYQTVFKNGFYDSTEFEQVDVVGNIYNRLIMFNAQFIHAAPVYFGSTRENSRLFQLFFFDIDK